MTPPGCLGCLSIELRPQSDRNYTIKFYTCQKIKPVSEGCGLIARVGDAMRCLQAPVVFCIFEADAGQVRSLTSLRFQASRSLGVGIGLSGLCTQPLSKLPSLK